MESQALTQFGHNFLLGLQLSTVLTDHDKRLLSAVSPAGVILFKANFRQDLPYDGWLAEYERLLNDVREHIGRERFLVCIDHEGGRVVRPPQPITAFDFARHWTHAAEAVGGAVGVELASLGINVNFAPVIDVDSNPGNPVIAERAFSSDTRRVAEAGLAYIEALQAAGVLACPKHFPGHGDTDADSHFALPRVDETIEELHARELVPFARVVDRVPLMMSAHIIYENVDPVVPATLSRKILTGVLREDLGFHGVVVSDDLGMKAIAPYFDDPASAPRAIVAGCDLLALCAHWTDTSRMLDLAQAVAALAQRETAAADCLMESKTRVERLLAEAPTPKVTRLPDAVFEAHRQLAPLYRQGTGKREYTGISA